MALHVVHFIQALRAGGAERLLHTNLSHLDRERYRSTVVTLFAEAEHDHWRQPIRDLGVPVHSLGCRSRRDLVGGLVKLSNLLRREKPDLLHTHLWAPDVIGRVAGHLTGVPVVSSIHSTPYEPEAINEGAGGGGLSGAVIRGLDAWSARIGCRRILTVSDYARQSAHRHLGIPADRMDVLYNPIDLEELEGKPPRDRAELLAEIGVPPDAQVLLNVGSVRPAKGLLYAVQALPVVCKEHPGVHLVAAGGVNSEKWLRYLLAEAERLEVADRLHILGPRRDIPDLLHACDLFLFPSVYEGLGIALIEAMAAGRAAIACRMGPIPEVVTHGTDGWLVPPRDSAAIAEAVCTLLSNPDQRAALAAAAYESSRRRFRPEEAARRLEAIYDAVAGKAARREEV